MQREEQKSAWWPNCLRMPNAEKRRSSRECLRSMQLLALEKALAAPGSCVPLQSMSVPAYAFVASSKNFDGLTSPAQRLRPAATTVTQGYCERAEVRCSVELGCTAQLQESE